MPGTPGAPRTPGGPGAPRTSGPSGAPGAPPPWQPYAPAQPWNAPAQPPAQPPAQQPVQPYEPAKPWNAPAQPPNAPAQPRNTPAKAWSQPAKTWSAPAQPWSAATTNGAGGSGTSKSSRLGQFGRNTTGWRRWFIPVSIGVIALLLLGVIGNGAAIYLTHSAMQRDQATLDSALAAARSQYNVPPSRLAPIQDAEQRAIAGAGGSFTGYQRADSTIVSLTRQVDALTHTDPAQARAMTQADLTALNAGVATLSKGQYVEAKGFQTRQQQAQTQFTTATTTPQYFAVDTYALDQLAAVNAFEPTYNKLQDLTAFVKAENLLVNGDATLAAASGTHDLQCAQGLNESFWLDNPAIQIKNTTTASVVTLPEAAWPAADLTQLRNAASSADFDALNKTLASQSQQALANESSLLPGVAKNLLSEFQTDITLMQQQKQDTSKFDPLYAQDQQQAQTLAANPSVTGYTTLITTLRKHIAQIGLPLIKAKTSSDLAAFNVLLAKGMAMKTVDPANGIGYPIAYEYKDPNTGIGDATQRLAQAKTADDYQLVDDEILMFTTNLQAMIDDTKDPSFNVGTAASGANGPSNPKAYWKVAHQTDIDLLNHYGLTGTKVVVVSFVEQAARLYDNGKLVKGFKVTTGAPDLPSVPGVHCVLDHLTNTVFKSPDPPGSPNYYLPTPIHYAADYSYYGYSLHDAWWRSWFGRYSNLPHYDPAAFNGGSHGCINFSFVGGTSSDAAYMWNFVNIGTPVIVY